MSEMYRAFFEKKIYDKLVDLGVNYSLLYPIQKEVNQQKWVLLHRNGDIMEISWDVTKNMIWRTAG